MAYIAKLGEVKSTDEFGGTDIYIDIFRTDEAGNQVFVMTKAVHFDTPPLLEEIQAHPLIQEMFVALNAGGTAARLMALQMAKGQEFMI